MIRILLKRKVVLLGFIVATLIIIGVQIFLNMENERDGKKHRAVDNDDVPITTSVTDTGTHQALDNIAVRIHTAQKDIRNIVYQSTAINASFPILPGIKTYLPHLSSRPDWLIPKIKISKNRTNVSFVIGIPSIRRPVEIYVLNTLQSLFSGMSDKEKDETLIILFIAEPWNETYVTHIVGELQVRFHAEILQGLLDIITPKAEFYPNLDNLKLSFGDSKERVKWRSKQNLDYAFLILHAWSHGKYYLQLEDDLTAVPHFITSMKEAITKNYWEWFSLEFSTLGFIGRMFRSEDALKIMEFLLMFYSSKPCDWLYDDFLQVKMCGHGEQWSKCLQKIQNIARSVKPSLFQHEGARSSLGGTVNKLKDKAFGGNQSTTFNPPVQNIITTLQTYSKFDIYSAYNGQDIFWGSNPKEGDVIDFLFTEAIPLAKVYVETGNTEHPDDIIRNATLEILPHDMPLESSALYKNKMQNQGELVNLQQKLAYEQRISSNPDLPTQSTNDTFFSIGEFNNLGVASIDIPKEAGKIWVLRVHIRSTSVTWIVIKKIALQV